jgi:hypothetical protein
MMTLIYHSSNESVMELRCTIKTTILVQSFEYVNICPGLQRPVPLHSEELTKSVQAKTAFSIRSVTTGDTEGIYYCNCTRS